MKNYLKFVAVAAASVLTFAACTKTDDGSKDAEVITVANDTVNFVARGAAQMAIAVTTQNCDDWAVLSADTWCHAERAMGSSGEIVTLSVDNNTGTARSTMVILSGAKAQATIIVNQLGFEPSITLSTKSMDLRADTCTIAVAVTANIPYTIEPQADWVTFKDSLKGVARFKVAKNEVTKVRTTTIVFASDAERVETALTINQAAAEEAHRVRDTKDIFVPFASVTTPKSNANYPIENVFDNKLDTYWQTPSLGVTAPAQLTFSFDGTKRLDYMVYYPSPDYGQWGKGTVQYKTADASRYTDLGDFDFAMKDTPDTIYFNTGIIGITEVVVNVTTANSRSYSTGVLAGASEIEFFHHDDYRYPIELFKDLSCSAFIDGFKAADTTKIKDSDMLYVARHLLASDYDPEFRVADYPTYPHPDYDAARFHTSPYGQYDNVTGIQFSKPGEYVICVGDKSGISLKLSVMNYKVPIEGNTSSFTITTTDYMLREGINRITVQAGLAYLKYFSMQKANVRVNFVDGDVNGYYDAQTMPGSKFDTELARSIALGKATGFAAHFDMRGRKVQETMPTDMVYRWTRTGLRAKQLLATLDSIMALEEILQGHVKYKTGGHANRQRMRGSYGGSYMYAGAYETGYDITVEAVQKCCLDPTYIPANCWGLAHETGHTNQITKGFKWVGMTETSNNVCSAYVMYCLNNGNTIMQSRTNDLGYQAAMRDIMLKGIAHSLAGSWDGMYYEKLIPFWQLQLYYGFVKGMDFYPDVYNALRNRTNNETISDEDAQLSFCELCSDVAKENLTDFFKAWGLLTPVNNIYFNDYGSRPINISQARIDKAIAYMSKYPKPKQAIQYITERNMDLYKNPKTVTAGTFVHADGSAYYRFENWQNCVVLLVKGSDGVTRGITEPSTNTSCNTSWTVYDWGTAAGVKSPTGENSSEYFCTINPHSVSMHSGNTPALATPSVFGVGPDGTLYPATNNPK